ncbi:MAG TPA: hypothetical protein VFN74_07810 [Chloroflexota bacterium]|nr:hypothetical protein [Chloroflexota bacterium]
MRRRPLFTVAAWRIAWSAAPLTATACGPPAAAVVAQEDPTLLQEILRRQEQRVVQATAEVEKLERELRLVQMRRRMLERAGRHDLATALGYEEHGLQAQLANAQRALTDEEDALAIYRRRGEPSAATP